MMSKTEIAKLAKHDAAAIASAQRQLREAFERFAPAAEKARRSLLHFVETYQSALADELKKIRAATPPREREN